ncbi:MAG: glucose-6-phosphate dehydrogenase [Alphaproteobacteria bacterium]|nr:glucose-6-phosphate dehydrogenase [Alphaproteobacteria bacterium]
MATSQVVIFGASGDLTGRKLIPSLLRNFAEGALRDDIQVIGVSRSEKSDKQWRDELDAWIPASLKDAWVTFRAHLTWCQANSANPEHMEHLEHHLDSLARDRGARPEEVGRLFYLALAPSLFDPTVQALDVRRMLECTPGSKVGWRRVVVEKPFGVDLESARALNQALLRYLREEQIFRIDHYLGKETVQNILSLRFQNAIFEPLWSRKHVESVEISVCETVAMEGRRGEYYDKAGATRDMLQNHVLQVLSLVAMEPPSSMRADAIRNEKVKVLDALRAFTEHDIMEHVVRAQYTSSATRDRGYLDEYGVNPKSETETYIAVRALIDNWRWSGVPFMLRTGKALSKRYTEVVLNFRTPPLDLLNGPQPGDVCPLRPNRLRLLIQPQEGVRLSFLVKQPGAGMIMRYSELGFDYSDLETGETPDAYQRLLLDALEGNATLFIRGDEVEAAWRFVDAIRHGWNHSSAPVHTYPAGSMGPRIANELYQGCEGTWGTGPEDA